MKTEKFIVLGMQRSGTTVTHVCLAGHPEVCMAPDEVYVEPFFTRGLAAFTGGKESYKDRKDGYARLFDQIAGFHAQESTRAQGFKVAIGSASDAMDVANCLSEYLPDLKVILVHRSDLAAQFGSLQRAMVSGEWHAWEGEKSRNGHKVTLPREEFLAYAGDALAALTQLRLLKETHRVLEFNYEEDILPGERYQALFDFLEVPRVPITWMKMAKVAPPPADYIANYEDMYALVATLPLPTAEEARAAAQRRNEEHARVERPLFLGYRACAYLDEGRVEEAGRDFLIAFHKRVQGGLDLSLQGRMCGKFQGLEGHPEVLEAVAKLREESGRYAHFRLNQAHALLEGRRFYDAGREVVALLEAEPGLENGFCRKAFDVLVDALMGLADLGAAQEAIQKLEPSHGDHEGLLLLKGLLARYRGDHEEALEFLRAAQAAAPQYRRVRDFLTWWTAEKTG